MQATATATDPLAATATGSATFSAGGATGVRTVRTSFFENRINWGNSIDESTRGPDLNSTDYVQAPAGPLTLGHTFTAIDACRNTGVRIYKHPSAAGSIPVALWDAAGTQLASKTLTWTSDAGGWQTVTWDSPVTLTADAAYNWGYHFPGIDSHYAVSVYVWNNSQDTCVYPLLMLNYSSSGSGTKSGGSWLKLGSSLTFSNAAADRSAANYYIDPIVEWDLDTPGYSSGEDYYDQFVNGGSRFDFPIAVYWADPPYIAGYKAIGVNTMFAGSVTNDYVAAFKAAGMDWYPTLHGGDMSAPIAVQEDPDLAAIIRGYMLTDEPEFNFNPFYPPSTLRTWRDACRRIDSTRPIHLNMSRLVIENQSFVWHPVGISAKDVNLQWREYMSLVDVGSNDTYGIANTYPYTYSSSDSRRYGIWIYPLTVKRMLREITDERMPMWAVVETTSSYAGAPTPEQVKRAVWASLIAGARGIEYFDHRFSSPAVGQDFAAMLHDPSMSAAVSALNNQMQSLAPALWAADAGLIDGYTSTGTMATAQGGYAAGAKVPMHYTSRIAGGSTYIFAQSIRDGSTTATFSAPSLAGAELTVIGESRTVTIDGAGSFSDTFSSDYAYHLYTTGAEPTFTAPANTVLPAVTTDGTPETGETITSSTGTWTGVPAPSYTYQWQRDGVNISSATTAAYVLQAADEGKAVRCVVTATNVAGSAAANSATVTPSAPAAPPVSGYPAAVLADSPVAYWRLLDLTDSAGAFTLTAAGSPVGDVSLITDTADGSKKFTSDSTQTLSVADSASLRLTTSFTAECWLRADFMPAGFVALQKNDHYRIRTGGDGKLHAFVYTTGGNFWEITSTTTISAGSTYHVVLTFDGTTARLYVNGSADGTVTVSAGAITTTASHVCIGKDLDSGNSGFFGAVDEVAIYGSVLDSTRIAAHYAAGTA